MSDLTTLDDRHQYFNHFGSDCGSCRHYIDNEYCCAAFPDEIPLEIQSGEVKHRTPMEGQGNEIVYESGELFRFDGENE